MKTAIYPVRTQPSKSPIGVIVTLDGFEHKELFISASRLGEVFGAPRYAGPIINGRLSYPTKLVWNDGSWSFADCNWKVDRKDEITSFTVHNNYNPHIQISFN